jgi:hypothetical protein
MKRPDWLMSTRNILGMLLGLELGLGAWILVADPGFRDFHDTIGLLRALVFNMWTFLIFTNGAGLWPHVATLTVDAAVIAGLWRAPAHRLTYLLALAYFGTRVGAGLFSAWATPYCLCEIGALTHTLIQGGALANLFPVSLCGLCLGVLAQRASLNAPSAR